MDVYRIKCLQIKSSPKFLCLVVCFIIPIFVNAQVEKPDSLGADSTKIQLVKENEAILISDVQLLDSVPQDSLSFLLPLQKKRIPARAALYSTLVPGLGQAYNGKYWKIPIIYTLFAGMFYLANENHQKYSEYKEAYKYFNDENLRPAWVAEYYTRKNLRERMDYYKRTRDFNIIIGVIFYLMNILDANVDAHLMNFDVSDDLSLELQPELNLYQAYQKNTNISNFGIKFVLSLNK